MAQTYTINDPFYLDSLQHPGRRFTARLADLCIYLTLYYAAQYLYFRWNPDINLVSLLIANYATFGFMVMLEPLLLAAFGTTPGKWIFGIRVYTKDGNRLPYPRALNRTVSLFKSGLGYGVPVYSLTRMAKSRYQCTKRKPLEWDEEISYVLKDAKAWRKASFAALLVLLLAINILIMLQAMLPLHRGGITPPQYVENIQDVGSRQSLLLTRDVFVNGEQVGRLHEGYEGELPPEHTLTAAEGHVRSVSFTIHDTEGKVHTVYGGEKALLFQAFFGAQPGMNCFTFAFDPIYEQLLNRTDSYTLESQGMRITNEVAYSGYTVQNGVYVPQENVQEKSFTLHFTMERME